MAKTIRYTHRGWFWLCPVHWGACPACPGCGGFFMRPRHWSFLLLVYVSFGIQRAISTLQFLFTGEASGPTVFLTGRLPADKVIEATTE